jgi:hypothetical protein
VTIVTKLSAIATGAALMTLTSVGTAHAATIVLDFEGIGDLNPVGNFYDTAPQDFNITFSPNALALIDQDAGGSGNFGGEPSPSTTLFFLTGPAATMNVLDGFTTGFSFFYSAINQPGFINVYDGLNATGNILATLQLPLTPFNGAPDPTGSFSPLVPIGVAFAGTALSIDFGGTVNQIVFDNITLGSSTPVGPTTAVPEPTTILGSLAVAGVVTKLKLKQKQQKANAS